MANRQIFQSGERLLNDWTGNGRSSGSDQEKESEDLDANVGQNHLNTNVKIGILHGSQGGSKGNAMQQDMEDNIIVGLETGGHKVKHFDPDFQH